MLDKNEVLRTLKVLVPNIVITINKELRILEDCLNWLRNNTVSDLLSSGEISWSGSIDKSTELKVWEQPYRVVGIDGSQIYPDRHQGINCFLLNLGFAEFSYAEQSSVVLKSIPKLYFENDVDYELSTENINYLRTEQELYAGFEYSNIVRKVRKTEPFIVLFDGPLYFWYLYNRTEPIKNQFLSSYMRSLQLFYSNRIPLVGFLSAPKNKDIINLIKKGLAEKIINLGYNVSNDLPFATDADFVSLFLKPYSRTPLFYLSSNLSLNYPAHLRPCFCYINFETEIVRIEFPQWLTEEHDFDKYLAILIDQCKKGNSYPIALSEAHEQAVVKNFDREFFYSALQRIGGQNQHTLLPSQKSIKKKLVGV